MKLLYLSCHSILEYDELAIFEELGIDYFSLGSYIKPWEPVDPIRPPLKHKPDKWLLENAPLREEITRKFVDKFDAVVIMHVRDWIMKNWVAFEGRRVIWRTIGQSTPDYERSLFDYRMKGLEVVRYSKREANIRDTIGSDMVIPFYKAPEEFKGWNGMNPEVITFCQNMMHRGDFCGYQHFMAITQGFNAKVYGPNNEQMGGLNGGLLSYAEMKQKMRDSAVYIYTGTQPASYTLNFIEAMMTGIPVVAIGPKLWNSLGLAGDVYEIPDIIQNGVNGFWSDDISELRRAVDILLRDKAAAKRIGQLGRETAIERFGKDMVKSKWKQFLKV